MLEVKNLVRKYVQGNMEILAVNDVSFKIERTSFVVLAGPSGSGKTTILNMIGSLDRPTSGEIIVDGDNIVGKSSSYLAKFRLAKLGFVFQSYNIFPTLNAIENVELPLILRGLSKEEARTRALDMLKRVSLDKLEKRFPSELSGGQQQRVAVARAFALKPRIILGDEPTANLDGATAESLVDLIKELKTDYDITFLVSSHDKRVIDRSERVLYLEDGKLKSDKN